MIMITCLPDEVIDIILSYNINIEDIINFRCVCKHFQFAAKYNKFMERKFFQRWPSAKKLYDKQFKENEQKKENKQEDERDFVELGINFTRELRSYMPEIRNLLNYYVYNYDGTLDCVDHFEIFVEHEPLFDPMSMHPKALKYNFFIDELKNLITQSSWRTDCNLTERYFNTKLYCNLRQWPVNYEWQMYCLDYSLREQLTERVATYLAQFLQPYKDVSYSCVKASLDRVAQEVLICLKKKHPNHSIFLASAETFSYWRDNNIFENHWNEAEGTQIMNTLEEYVFGELNFRPNNLETLENLCIDNVLKNKYGIDLIVLIIYHSVARRLGLYCDIISVEEKICLFWRSNQATDSLENARCYNVTLEKFPDCLLNQLSLFNYARVMPAVALQTLNFLKSCYWKNLLYDTSFSSTLIDHDTNHRDILSRKFRKTYQSDRSQDIKFAVGMIVTHDNNCTGVITGWYQGDKVNEIAYTNSVWNPDADDRKIGVKHCFCSCPVRSQIFYIIFTENDKICFVGQDDITLTNPKRIDNSEIGRYFCKFDGTHYVSNEFLVELYPHDAAVIAQTHIAISEK